MRTTPILLATLLAACGTSDLEVLPGAGDRNVESQLIINGSAPNAPEHAATVGLHQLANGGSSVYVAPFCSGTLIRPDVVLTAAHCLDTARFNKPNFQTMDPSALAIYVGDEPALDIVDHLYFAVETEINPTYDRFALRNDIALVRLDRPVTEAVPVPELPQSLEITDATDAGTLVNFAGFGITESSNSTGVKLQVDITLGGVGCGGAPGCSGADAATQVGYAQDAGVGGPCSGDSGGPMFVNRSGTVYVAGITSYGDANCTLYGVSTKVDAYESYIATFAGGGGTDTGTGGGTGGTDPGTCGDGVCDANESCDGRSGTDLCSADCDGKTNGKPSGRYCYVGGVCEGDGCP